jgi:GNAT superfamily N-acetyltransferase
MTDLDQRAWYVACAQGAGVPWGVLGHARSRGVGAAMTSWLLEQAFSYGVDLAHLNPNTEAAARLYRRLGFTETLGFDVHVDL